MKGRPNVIFSPHLDDAALSLGGLLSLEPNTTTVVTLFTGKPKQPMHTKWDKRCGFSNSDEAIEERLIENLNAMSIMGIPASRIVNLPFLDSQYRNKDETVRQPIITKISEIVKNSPDNTDFFCPIMEYHADHRLVKQCFLEAIRARSHSQTFYFYEDIPYVFLANKKLKEYTSVFTPSECVAVNFAEGEMEKKLAAIKEYPSQLLGLAKLIPLIYKWISHKSESPLIYTERVYRLKSSSNILY